MNLEVGDVVEIDGEPWEFVGYVDGDLMFEPEPSLFAQEQKFIDPVDAEEVIG